MLCNKGLREMAMFNRVLFIGSKESGFKLLKEIVSISRETLVGCVTVDDSDDVRTQLESFRTYCSKKCIDLDILNGKCDITDSLSKFKPDLCIVMGWYYIIKPEQLDSVKGGFIGIHNSLLPRHRGFAPVVWAIIAGDKETGFSIFSFDKGMDTGDIWYQGKVEIEKDDYISDVIDKIDWKIETFFRDNYLHLLNGRIKPKMQTNEGVSYGAKRQPQDGLLDWTLRADRIYDYIRAQAKPYPGAFTLLKGQKCIIWKACVFPYSVQGKPGQIGIIDSENNKIIVVCGGDTGLEISEFEIDGKILRTTDVIKSYNCFLGI